MAPSLVLDHEQPRLVVGSAGSIRLRGAIMQIVINVVQHGMPVEEAIAAPRVHVDNGHVHCEGGCDPAELDRLERLGYELIRWRRQNLYFGGPRRSSGATTAASQRPAIRAAAATGSSSRRMSDWDLVRPAVPADADALVALDVTSPPRRSSG